MKTPPAVSTHPFPLRGIRCGLAPVISLVMLGSAALLPAASITPGNLVIYRVGDGAAALTTAATAVFLDEYTTAGVLVQSIPVASSGASSLTAVGNSSTEGIMSRSQDGNSLVFAGYRKDAGGTNPSSDVGATTNRVLATVGISGLVNTSIALTDPTGSMRSATTTDGSLFYAGTSTGVRYVSTPSGSATSVVIDTRNSREVLLSGGVLYASNGSTAVTGKVQTYGTFPTTATAATVLANLATGDAVNGFVMFDLNAGVAGDDTLYALSTVANTILKYSFDGTAWTASGSVPAGGAANLTGLAGGGNVNLFLTTSTTVLPFTDSTGHNGSLTGTVGSALVTAAANTGFRGISQFAVPEPSSSLLGFMAAALLLRRRRR